MNDDLLDTSWTLQYVPVTTQPYRDIFQSPSQARLQKYTDRLTQYLANHRPQYADEIEDENEKLGSLRECRWSSLTASTGTNTNANTNNNNTTPTATSISISLSYQNQTYKFILSSPFLILTKSSLTHSSRLFAFLSQSFSISIETLKLPTPFLSSTLSSYLTHLTGPFSRRPDDPDETNQTLVLRAALGTLKLTVSFSGPVAPSLRTVDVDVPYETVDALLSSSLSGRSDTNDAVATAATHQLNDSPGDRLLANLSTHLTQQTGLKLPLAPTRPTPDQADAPPLRLSKMTTAAFAISVEGRIKFSARAIENAMGYGDLVRAANGEMLRAVEQEARRRSVDRSDE